MNPASDEPPNQSGLLTPKLGQLLEVHLPQYCPPETSPRPWLTAHRQPPPPKGLCGLDHGCLISIKDSPLKTKTKLDSNDPVSFSQGFQLRSLSFCSSSSQPNEAICIAVLL